MTTMQTNILTPLSDFAKQRGITRQRAYVLKSRLKLVELPVYAISDTGNKIPLYQDGKPLTHTFVVQSTAEIKAEIAMLKAQLLAKETKTDAIPGLTNRILALNNALKRWTSQD